MRSVGRVILGISFGVSFALGFCFAILKELVKQFYYCCVGLAVMAIVIGVLASLVRMAYVFSEQTLKGLAVVGIAICGFVILVEFNEMGKEVVKDLSNLRRRK